jgi:hypothetical protein
VPFVTRHAQYDVKVWYVPWDGGKSGARKGVHGGSVLECLCCGLWRRKREKGSRQVLWPLAEEATLQDSKCRCSTGTSYAVVFLLSFTIDDVPSLGRNPTDARAQLMVTSKRNNLEDSKSKRCERRKTEWC